MEADEFFEKLFEQLNAKNIPEFLPSSLTEKMRAKNIRINPYVSLMDIAEKRKHPLQAISFNVYYSVAFNGE